MAGLSKSEFQDKVARENAIMRSRVYPSGLSKCISPLTIVCGPPAAGKTMYCKQHMDSGDLLIDIDELKGGGHQLAANPSAALERRNQILRSLSSKSYPRVWLIVCCPAQARCFSESLGGSVVYVCPPMETTLAQCMGDKSRPKQQTIEMIRDWYALHDRHHQYSSSSKNSVHVNTNQIDTV